jgi:hypothetical protein
MRIYLFSLLLLLTAGVARAQTIDSLTGRVLSFPSRLLGHIQSRTADLNRDMTLQTEKMLQGMARREAKMQQRLVATDSIGARNLFSNSQKEYASLIQQMQSGPAKPLPPTGGVYQPYMDSLKGAVTFLNKNPGLLSGSGNGLPADLQGRLNGAAGELQSAQVKLQVVAQAKAFIQQRRQQISQYIARHANVQGILSKPYGVMNQDVYYYSQRAQQYRDLLNSPDRMEKQALARLSGLPAFQSFMKNNSELSGLFSIPGAGMGTGAGQPLPGLQTHVQVSQQVQGQVAASGEAGMNAFQSKLQSAQQQLNSYKSKLNNLGAGSTPGDIPDFRPNDQKTKTLWRRLEYGVNFQTTHTNYYYPIVTDLGVSLGYRLAHGRVIGLGASYKLGWGSGINHIAITSQGAGLRSFIQVPVKGSFSATGGFEYNYTTPFTSYQQLRQLEYWTKSGLIGVTKTISLKSKLLKKTQLQLLWDFLSYQQTPKTQPILFRIGYAF